MSRYKSPTGAEAEAEPGSRGRVLRNLQGLVTKTAMDRMEYELLTRTQIAYLDIITSETRFTAVLLRQMHRDWLGSIYPWAGDYRTVEMQKGGFTWPPAYLIPQNMARLETDLLARYTPCRSASTDIVSRRLAEVHAELLLIHPFREGNGRLARWLAELMALQAGLPVPVWPFAGRGAKKQRSKYLDAVVRGYCQDYDPLSIFFREAIERGFRTSR